MCSIRNMRKSPKKCNIEISEYLHIAVLACSACASNERTEVLCACGARNVLWFRPVYCGDGLI